MNEESKRILNMLADGVINAQEAERLIDAMGRKSIETTTNAAAAAAAKYLRVIVEDDKGEHGGRVNIRVPLNLIRAGVRLAALLPQTAYEQVNKALKEQGMDFDVSQIKPENIEELVQHLNELSVDVDGNKGEKVRVFCE